MLFQQSMLLPKGSQNTFPSLALFQVFAKIHANCKHPRKIELHHISTPHFNRCFGRQSPKNIDNAFSKAHSAVFTKNMRGGSDSGKVNVVLGLGPRFTMGTDYQGYRWFVEMKE